MTKWLSLDWKKKIEAECVRCLIFTQVNGLKTTNVTNYIFILRVLGYLTLTVNADGCSCSKYGILKVSVYFRSSSW